MNKADISLATLLQWQYDMGIDEAIDPTPRNRYALPDTTLPHTTIGASTMPHTNNKATTTPSQSSTTSSSPANTPNNHIATARKLADQCNTLEELRSAIESFDGCAIKKTANKTVFCDGIAESDLMLVGEAPGANEDMEGIPFCGVSGRLLEHMLNAIGYYRSKNYYITNTVFWRPPGNRRPTPEEIAICSPFVQKHIALIRPKLIVMVGGTAIASLMGKEMAVSKIRGTFFDYDNPYLENSLSCYAMFHPSYLLRQPMQKKQSWHDMLRIQAFLESTPPKI